MSEHCPHLKSCAKRSDKRRCLHWLTFPMARAGEPLNAPATMQSDCAYNWAARFAFNACQNLIGVQHATEGARNRIQDANETMLRLASAGGRLLDARDAD